MKTLAFHLPLLACVLVAAGCSDNQRAETARASPLTVALPPAGSDTASRCLDPNSDLRTTYAQHMAAQRYLDAAQVIRPCSRSTAAVDTKGLLADAEIKNLSSRGADKALSIESRLLAYEALQTDYPDQAAVVEQPIAKLRQAAAVEYAAAQKQEMAERKKQGVSVGMTADRVRESKWGKPRKINRTTNAFGVREQWVYDGGYLYFENDVLVSIQN